MNPAVLDPILRCDPSGGTAEDRPPRRVLELSAFGVLDDGTTFGVKVVDLSYDGCKVETGLALMPGLSLRISVVGLGNALRATVCWYHDGLAGLRFNQEDAEPATLVPRRHTRVDLAAHLSLRRFGRHHYEGRLFDCSATGCKVEFVERPKKGEILWCKFDGLEAIEARVRWVDGFSGGLEFIRPIYPAVFELLLRRLQHA